jgi:hypothetical protein
MAALRPLASCDRRHRSGCWTLRWRLPAQRVGGGRTARERLRINSCCLTRTDSATTAHPARTAPVATKWRSRTASSRRACPNNLGEIKEMLRDFGIRHAQGAQPGNRILMAKLNETARTASSQTSVRTSTAVSFQFSFGVRLAQRWYLLMTLALPALWRPQAPCFLHRSQRRFPPGRTLAAARPSGLRVL